MCPRKLQRQTRFGLTDNPPVRTFVIQGWTDSVLSCTRTSIWQMFPKGWNARPFQKDWQATLIAVSFVSPAGFARWNPAVNLIHGVFPFL